MTIYQGKKVILATMHQKQEVIAPIFQQLTGLFVEVPFDLNTDQFGTFSGEIAREGTPKEVVLKKATYAVEKYGYDYALASEGSFGPHPLIPFTPLNTEMMVFVDRKNNLHIFEHELTDKTNYQFHTLEAKDTYDYVLEKMLFPSHGVMVRALKNNQIMAKGIHDIYTLQEALTKGFEYSDKVRIETDMRAMHNPTRMEMIAKVATKLAQRLNTHCPSCAKPGFAEKSFAGCLPCEWCGADTELYAKVVMSCLSCDYKEERPREDQKRKSEPKYCQYCNP